MISDKEQRIIDARLKLRARFKEKIAATPSLTDNEPQGSGNTNRHGMPQLPVGQHETNKWPVLDLGIHPEVTTAEWSLELTGACEGAKLSWADFQRLPIVSDTSDFHCVTTWSRMDIKWKGVRFSEIAALALPNEDASHVMCYASDGYSTNVSLTEAMKDDVLLAFEADGEPLAKEHGGPVRMITPQLYAWKGAKWINKIEFMTSDKAGFWEQRGYSMSAYPWRNDRYS